MKYQASFTILMDRLERFSAVLLRLALGVAFIAAAVDCIRFRRAGGEVTFLHFFQLPSALVWAAIALEMRNVRHTSNALEYIKTFVSDYRNEDYYVNELAVTDGNLIAVSGLGSIEFAREIIRRLGIYNERDAELWFELFKHGIYHLLPSQASPATDGQKGATK